MAVLGRLLVSSAERLDLPDLLSLDSYAAGDWRYFLKGLVGDTKPYILKGFDVIDPLNAIGTQSCSIRVADSVTFYPGSNSGSFFHGLQEGHPQAAPLVPELRKNAVNYVYLTFSTFNTSVDTRAFWDPDKDGGVGGEFTQDINTESVLEVEVNVSTGSFPANTIPVAKITVGPVVITAIEDARDLMFRLGSGGINPNPFNTYGWRSLPNGTYARQEPPTQMLAGGVNPFQGADKNILTLKEWMDAIMSKLRELGGTTYWYDDTSSFSIITNFYDAVATAFKSKGKWIHDTTTPGLLTWTEDVQIKMTSDPRTYIIRQGSKNLADEQVMWLDMQRNLLFNTTDENVQWINGQPYVNTIGGAVGLFANLSKGDYIKKANDTIDKWVRVEEFYDAVNLGGSTTTAAGARSVRLGSAYLGGTGAEKGRYDKGVYLPADVQVTDRDVAGIAVAGGRFHWLALRSDTIENVGNAVTTSLSVAIDQHDGSTARVTSVAHGLVDGDRVTITGTTNFDGTYQVEVETADIFYINVSGGPFADESGSAYYAVITTAARLTPYGFQEESSNHGFNSNDTITIDNTTDYDGQYLINVRDNTTFQIAMPGPAGTETSGTATLARVIVRNEGGVSELIQGEIIDIGGSAVDNIRQYIGMQSLSETAPTYNVPPSYNTLDGMANYNGVINENLTIRIAKLTAMMADKAQDKTIKFLLNNGITTITNTQNGSAQELRFLPDGASLTIVTPSSDGQSFLALPDTANPLSLLQNQAAYVQIDRNNPGNVTMSVAAIDAVPLEENTFVIAVRINTPDIYIWDGSIITVGSQPAPAYLSTIVRQNQMLKLVEGGTWSWDLGTETLTWDADAFVQIPGLANAVNQITAGSVVLAAGEVAYVDINRVGPGGVLTVSVAANDTLPLVTDRFILARRETTDVIVGLHSMRLVDGESKKLYAGMSDQNLAFIGATDEGDDAPVYGSNNYVTDGESLVSAISALDAAAGSSAANNRQDRNCKLVQGGTWSWSNNSPTSIAENLAVPDPGAMVIIANTGAGSRQGQSFTPASNFNISTVMFRLDSNLGTETAAVDIYDDNAGVPGTIIGTSDTQSITAPPPGMDITFNFSVPVPVLSGTVYHAIIRPISGSISGYGNSASNPYPGGQFQYGDDVGNWVPNIVPNRDFYFSINEAAVPGTLTWDSSAYIQVPGLDNVVNEIPADSIQLAAGQVAYVDINRTGPGGVLTVNIADNDSLVLTDNSFIFAREENGAVIVGLGSIRLIDGESKTLYTGVSNQLLTYMGAPNNASNSPQYWSNHRYISSGDTLTDAISSMDWEIDTIFSQLRVVPTNPVSQRVIVTGVNHALLTTPRISQEISGLLMQFEGAQIDFSTGNIYEADGVTPLGENFTPVTLPANDFIWYAISMVPGTVDSLNRAVPKLKVVPAAASDSVENNAPRAKFKGTKKIAQVLIRDNGTGGAGTVNNITSNQYIVQVMGGGSGGGDSEATEFVIANNQSSPAVIDDLIFDESTSKAAKLDYTIRRNHSDSITPPGILDITFVNNAVDSSKFNSIVNSVAVQSDNKVIVGGNFATYGSFGAYLTRLNSDGTEDTAFNSNIGFAAPVRAIAIQADGKILVGGDFANYNGNVGVNRLVRLNSDGTPDTAFNGQASSASRFSGAIYDIKVQADGKILVVGYFANYAGTAGRNSLVRLNSDGTLDTAFCTNAVDGTKFSDFAFSVYVQADNKILVGGGFNNYAGTANRNKLVRLNSDGTEDTTFNSNSSDSSKFSDSVWSVVEQSDNKILVGGQFVDYAGTSSRSRLVRLNSDGTEDTTFNSTVVDGNFNNSVTCILIQPTDDKVLIGGGFSNYDGTTDRNRLIRLNTDDTLDTTFVNNAVDGNKFSVSTVNSLAFQPDEKIVVGGGFNGYGAIGGRDRLVRFNAEENIIGAKVAKTGQLWVQYNDDLSDWEIGGETSMGTDPGVVLSIDNTGQISYTSTDLPGTIVESYIRWKINSL